MKIHGIDAEFPENAGAVSVPLSHTKPRSPGVYFYRDPKWPKGSYQFVAVLVEQVGGKDVLVAESLVYSTGYFFRKRVDSIFGSHLWSQHSLPVPNLADIY